MRDVADDVGHSHAADATHEAPAGEVVRLRSVGIDIGSSTSHVLFSNITLERQGRHLSSRYEVVDRHVTHRSPVILTPYSRPERVDAAALERFVAESYAGAGCDRDEIDTGAVITTGEAARKENAPAIVELFAREAGKFVCASAGPHLESTLAAHGSGAAQLSLERGEDVLNVDIGGGSTKLALCRGGHVLETAALRVGARILAWDERGRLRRVEEIGARLLREAGGEPALGTRLHGERLDAVAAAVASTIVEAVAGGYHADDAEIWMTDALRTAGPFRTVVFSGGVSEYVYGREQREFGDLGPRLGRELVSRCRQLEVLEPREGIRATCIGAAQYTIQVSGNTIFLSHPDVLPVRNVPVAAVRGIVTASAAIVTAATRAALARLDADHGGVAALAVEWPHGTDYASLAALCEGLAAALVRGDESSEPVLIVLDADIANIVGRLLRDEFGLRAPIVCIDEVELREFDYVDLGALLSDQNVVPLVVKSLVFR
jgi:ethanolamine utilization protein EutA